MQRKTDYNFEYFIHPSNLLAVQFIVKVFFSTAITFEMLLKCKSTKLYFFNITHQDEAYLFPFNITRIFLNDKVINALCL